MKTISESLLKPDRVKLGNDYPPSKHYIVCPEKIHGRKDLANGARRKPSAGRSSHWETALGGNSPPVIQINCVETLIRKLQLQRRKPQGISKKVPKYD